jgi:hypothetical protein
MNSDMEVDEVDGDGVDKVGETITGGESERACAS